MPPRNRDHAQAAEEDDKKAKGKTSKKGKGAAAPEDTHHCFHCQSEGAKMCCSQCHRAWYCGKACQKKHWKQHKRACTAAVAAEAKTATLRREATAARGGGGVDKETCVICVGPVVAPVELPCGHAYCGECLAVLRTKKVAQACPLCRAELPPGLDGLWDLAYRAYVRIAGMVTRGEVSWASLPAALQGEIDEAVAMLTEAAAQGHIMAQAYLAEMYNFGYGVAQDYGRAFELCSQAARQGHATSQCNLGGMYHRGQRCEQSYERAAEWWAKAAEQRYAEAQTNLGHAYCAGDGVPQSYERAVELYRLSAAQGHAGATNCLGRCHHSGEGVDHSVAEARRLYELAVARGEAQVAPGNLQLINDDIQQVCPLLGQRVVLRGLNTAALNGTRGTAVDFGCSERHPEHGLLLASGRYMVRLDGAEGRLVKVRAANVEKEGEEGEGEGEGEGEVAFDPPAVD